MKPANGLIKNASSRLLALDYLRGFFIVVIIIDHAYRWPSPLIWLTGRGALWMTAAEGFVIISGLLIGYIRGYKNRELPLWEVAKKTLKRALLLYIWFIIATLFYVGASWYIPTQGSMPWVEISKFDWSLLFANTSTFAYSYVWVHFLYMYAIFLTLAPLAIWLLRKKQWLALVGASFAAYGLGILWDISWLQWQIFFFLPSIAGYHLPDLQRYWKSLTNAKRALALRLLAILTGVTVVGSVAVCLIAQAHPVSVWLDQHLFSKDPVGIGILPISALWFMALVALFEWKTPFIHKYFGWLLLPFGTRSLTAYIIHGVAILAMACVFRDSDSYLLNALVSTFAIMLTWALLKAPWVQRFIPR